MILNWVRFLLYPSTLQSETPISEAVNMYIDDDFLPDDTEDIIKQCEELNFISTTFYGEQKIYTDKELFACRLEYPRLVQFL